MVWGALLFCSPLRPGRFARGRWTTKTITMPASLGLDIAASHGPHVRGLLALSNMGDVLSPVALLVLCAIAGFGTFLLLPGRKTINLHRLGGAILFVAGDGFRGACHSTRSRQRRGDRPHLLLDLFGPRAVQRGARRHASQAGVLGVVLCTDGVFLGRPVRVDGSGVHGGSPSADLCRRNSHYICVRDHAGFTGEHRRFTDGWPRR